MIKKNTKADSYAFAHAQMIHSNIKVIHYGHSLKLDVTKEYLMIFDMNENLCNAFEITEKVKSQVNFKREEGGGAIINKIFFLRYKKRLFDTPNEKLKKTLLVRNFLKI